MNQLIVSLCILAVCSAHVIPHIPSGSVSVSKDGALVAGPAGSVHTDNGLHGHDAGAQISGPSGEVQTHGGHVALSGPGHDHGEGAWDNGNEGQWNGDAWNQGENGNDGQWHGDGAWDFDTWIRDNNGWNYGDDGQWNEEGAWNHGEDGQWNGDAWSQGKNGGNNNNGAWGHGDDGQWHGEGAWNNADDGQWHGDVHGHHGW